MLFTPETIRGQSPFFRHAHALVTQAVNVLRLDKVRRGRARFFHHFRQPARIDKQRTGPERIFIEGLILAVLHEQGSPQCLKQRLFMYIGIRIMDKSAGFPYNWHSILQKVPFNIREIIRIRRTRCSGLIFSYPPIRPQMRDIQLFAASASAHRFGQ